MIAKFVLPALVLACAAHAAELPDCATKGTWTRYDGEHVILYTNAPAEIGKRDALRLESFAWMLDRRSPTLRKRGASRVTAIGFASKGDYAPFRPVYEGKPVESVGFFLSGPLGKTLEFITSERPEDERIIYHEYLHSLVHDRIGNAPPWVNEGMADFFSTFALTGDRAHFGHPIPGFCWLIEHQDPLTIAQLTGMGHGHEYFQGNRRDMMYAESWALVHYLIHAYSSYDLEAAAVRLAAGESPDVVLADAYPKEDWATLPARLKTYANASEMDDFYLPLGASYVEPQVGSRAVDRAEILNALGDVMVQNERYSTGDAPAYYRAALAAKPDDAQAVRGLAMVNELRKFPKDAIPLYERAAAGTGADALTLGQCAEGIARAAVTDSVADSTTTAARYAKARGIAIKALALEPLEPRALSVLADVGEDDSLAAVESMPALEAAHDKDPKNALVTGALVRAYVRAGLDPAAEVLYTDDALKADREEYDRTSRTIERRMVERANAALAARRFAEGRAILERVRATTRNPELAALLDNEIASIGQMQDSNRWVERYNAGIRAVQAQKLDDALVIFQDVRQHADEERLIYESGKRIEEIQAFKKKYGR